MTCTITAQQTAELAASATLTVQVDQGVSYGADPQLGRWEALDLWGFGRSFRHC